MNFVDSTFLRLADADSRAELFDAASLEQIVTASFDTEAILVEGPFTAALDNVELGYPVRPPTTIEGAWTASATGDRTEATFRMAEGGSAGTRIDALWTGTIFAHALGSASTVEDVAVAWPSLSSIDDEIADRLGGLPTEPALLETERRTSLQARVRTGLGDPGSFEDAIVDRLLARHGVTSVGRLIERLGGTAHPAALRVAMSNGSTAAPTRIAFPVVAALLIRDDGFSVAELVSASRALPDQLNALGLRRPPHAHLPQRRPLLVIWLIPHEVFDDPGWPGGESAPTASAARAARRERAGQWLAREGIGLAVVEPQP